MAGLNWVDDMTWVAPTMPYIEESNYHDLIHFDLHWGDISNTRARHARMDLFACPEDTGLRDLLSPDAPGWIEDPCFGSTRGNYVVNWGNTNYGQTARGRTPFLGAPFTFEKGVPFGKIEDGTSSTLMVSECIMSIGFGFGSGHQGLIMMSKGGQTFSGKITPNFSTDLVTRGCPEPHELNGIPDCTLLANGWSQVFAQIYAARSKHVGGVNASHCDGSARFYSESIDAFVWEALSSSKGGETIGDTDR